MEQTVIRGLTACLSKATLTNGTTSTLTSTGTVIYSIEGKAYSHAALSNTATPTTDATTGNAFVPVPASQGCALVVGFNAAGTLLVAQGPLAPLSADADGANASFIGLAAPRFPDLPTDFCPIGYIINKVGASGATWTFGTSNTASGSNISNTFVDVTTLPTRPQAS